MNVVVVLGHPSANSYCAAIFQAVSEALKKQHQVSAIRLADENFVTAMSSAERRAYETEQPLISDETKRYAELLQNAEALIFVYPTWWSKQSWWLLGVSGALGGGVRLGDVLVEAPSRVQAWRGGSDFGGLGCRWMVGRRGDDGPVPIGGSEQHE